MELDIKGEKVQFYLHRGFLFSFVFSFFFFLGAGFAGQLDECGR